MNQQAMTAFLDASGKDPKIMICSNTASDDPPLNRKHVEQVIRQCLSIEVASNSRSPITFRLAGPDDVETVSQFVHQLAIYEMLLTFLPTIIW
jgi:hypothetical protein